MVLSGERVPQTSICCASCKRFGMKSSADEAVKRSIGIPGATRRAWVKTANPWTGFSSSAPALAPDCRDQPAIGLHDTSRLAQGVYAVSGVLKRVETSHHVERAVLEGKLL